MDDLMDDLQRLDELLDTIREIVETYERTEWSASSYLDLVKVLSELTNSAADGAGWIGRRT